RGWVTFSTWLCLHYESSVRGLTLYFAAASAFVKRLRQLQRLPFPDFSFQRRDQLAITIPSMLLEPVNERWHVFARKADPSNKFNILGHHVQREIVVSPFPTVVRRVTVTATTQVRCLVTIQNSADKGFGLIGV